MPYQKKLEIRNPEADMNIKKVPNRTRLEIKARKDVEALAGTTKNNKY